MGTRRIETSLIVRAVAEGFKQAQNEIENLGGAGQKAGQSGARGFSVLSGAAAGVAKVMGGVTAAAGLAVAAVRGIDKASQPWQQFETQLKEVFTLLPNLSQQAMGQMQADVKAFGAETGRLTTEVVPALYQSISAGVPQENVFEFLETASDAALGGVTDLETAVDGISSVVNAYGEEVVDATEASDLMFTAVKGGKTTFRELADRLFQVIPTAASLGVEFGNVTAAMATITAQGTPTRVAATQLRQLLVELSRAGGETAEAFERVAGKSFQQFIAEGGNLQDALVLMEQAAADNGVQLQDMFTSVEAGNAAMQLTGASAAKFTSELEAAAAAEGATAEAAETMRSTNAYLSQTVDALTEQLKIQIGEGLIPVKTATDEAKIALLQWSSEILTAAENAGFFQNVADGLSYVLGNMGRSTKELVQDRISEARSTEEIIRLYGDLASINGELRSMGQWDFAQRSTVEQLAGATRSVEEFRAALRGMADINRAAGAPRTGIDETYLRLLGSSNAELQAYMDAQREAVVAEKLLASARDSGSSYAEDAAYAEAELTAERRRAREVTGNYTQYLLDLADVREQSTSYYEDEAYAQGETLNNLRLERIAREQAAAATEEQRDLLEQERLAREAATQALRDSHAEMNKHFISAVEGSLKTEDLAAELLGLAGAAGAAPGALAGLGVALGEFDEKAAEAYLKTALMRSGLDSIASAFAETGDVYAARDAYAALIETVNNADFNIDPDGQLKRVVDNTVSDDTVQRFGELTGDMERIAEDSAEIDPDPLAAIAESSGTTAENMGAAADELETFSGLLAELPSEHTVTVTVVYNDPGYSTTTPSSGYIPEDDTPRAAGGVVNPGSLYRVNEPAGTREEYFMPRVPGYILSHEDARRAALGGGSGGGGLSIGNISINVDGFSGDAAAIGTAVIEQLGEWVNG